MTLRSRRGFTLIEVMAAFVIALVLIGPIAATIAGVAGTFAGLERSTQRRIDLQAAGAAAMTAGPLRPGSVAVGDFQVDITLAPFDRRADLERAGWRLYAVTVRKPGSAGPILETLRLGRP